MSRAGDGRAQDEDAGSASVWVLAAASLLVLVAFVVTTRTEAVLARHRADAIADLTALAGAGQIGTTADACRVAQIVAAVNGAAVHSCVAAIGPGGRSGTVTVAVEVRADLPLLGSRVVRATARAGRD